MLDLLVAEDRADDRVLRFGQRPVDVGDHDLLVGRGDVGEEAHLAAVAGHVREQVPHSDRKSPRAGERERESAVTVGGRPAERDPALRDAREQHDILVAEILVGNSVRELSSQHLARIRDARDHIDPAVARLAERGVHPVATVPKLARRGRRRVEALLVDAGRADLLRPVAGGHRRWLGHCLDARARGEQRDRHPLHADKGALSSGPVDADHALFTPHVTGSCERSRNRVAGSWECVATVLNRRLSPVARCLLDAPR